MKMMNECYPHEAAVYSESGIQERTDQPPQMAFVVTPLQDEPLALQSFLTWKKRVTVTYDYCVHCGHFLGNAQIEEDWYAGEAS